MRFRVDVCRAITTWEPEHRSSRAGGDRALLVPAFIGGGLGGGEGEARTGGLKLRVEYDVACVLVVAPMVIEVVLSRAQAEEAGEVHDEVVEPAGAEGGAVHALVEGHEIEGSDEGQGEATEDGQGEDGGSRGEEGRAEGVASGHEEDLGW